MKGNISNVYGLEEIILLRSQYYSKLSVYSMQDLSKSNFFFFGRSRNIKIHMESQTKKQSLQKRTKVNNIHLQI